MRIFLSPDRTQSNGEAENPYWISFSDIMAGLLVLFILSTVFLMIKLSKTQTKVENAIREIQNTQSIRAVMLNEIKEQLESKGIIVDVSENYSVLRIPDDRLYFESSSYEIPEDKKALVSEIGQALYYAITKEKRYKFIDTIFIEGHTDSKPATSLEMGNWGLSTYRAISVWKYWSEEPKYGSSLINLKNSYGKHMFSVSGYASTRPVITDDNTEEKRRKNRRIDLRFSMKKPIIADYETILDIMDTSDSE